MHKAFFKVGFIIFTAAVVHAEDWKTEDGKEYRNVEVVSKDAASVTVQHADGVSRIYFRDLPKDLQEKFGYDPKKADIHLDMEETEKRKIREEQIRREREAQMEAKVALRSLKATVIIFQITEDGVLGVVSLAGDYQIFDSRVNVGGWRLKEDVPAVVKELSRRRIVGTNRRGSNGKTVFVRGLGKGLVDGDTWTGIVYALGSYEYTNILGAKRTVFSFTVSSQEAKSYMMGAK